MKNKILLIFLFLLIVLPSVFSNVPPPPPPPPPPGGEDTTAPVITVIGPSGTQAEGTTSLTLQISTDEVATCKFDTTSGESYVNMNEVFSSTGTASHTHTISGLSEGTYTYYFKCIDSDSNSNDADSSTSFTIPTSISNINEYTVKKLSNSLDVNLGLPVEFDQLDQIVLSTTSSIARTAFLYDDNYFYVIQDTDDSSLEAVVTSGWFDTWNDDSIEMMFSIPGVDYRKILLTLNEQYLERTSDGTTNGNSNFLNEIEYSIVLDGTLNQNSDTDNGYTIMMKIPWSLTEHSLPDNVGFELNSNNRVSGNRVYSAWTNADAGGINNVEGYGLLSFSSETVSITQTSSPPPTEGAENLISETTFSSDSNNFAVGQESDKLWDGCVTTGVAGCAAGNSGESSFWVEFDFGKNYDLLEARLFGDNVGDWVSETWALRAKKGESDSWTTLFENKNALSSTWFSESISFEARYVRLEVNGGLDVQAREFELYGIVSDDNPPPPPDDITPPFLSNEAPTGVLSSGTIQTNLQITTNEEATCKYSTNAGRSFAAMEGSFSGTTIHSAPILVGDGQSYTYFVKCRDLSDNTNTADYVISFSVEEAPDTSGPIISEGSPSGLLPWTTTSTILSVRTNEQATCRYSTNSGSNYNSMTPFTVTGSTQHSGTISGLGSGNQYVYFVKCRDNQDNLNQQDYIIAFSVDDIADNTPPVLSNGFPSGNLPSGTNQISISVDTNEQATCRYAVSPRNSYSQMPFSLSFIPSTSHSGIVSLIDGQSYSYYIKCRDVYDNINLVDYTISFNVEFPADITAPILSGGEPFGELSSDTTSTLLKLTTNENSQCRFSTVPGISFNFMSESYLSTNFLTHSRTLTSLTSGTSYNYYSKCIDEAGNANQNDYPISFSVDEGDIPPPPPPPPPENDTSAPVIKFSEPDGLLPQGTNPVTLKITTDEDAFCKYDRTPGKLYPDMGDFFETSAGKEHEQLIYNLAEDEEHIYYVRCSDFDANSNTEDHIINFTIDKEDDAPPPPPPPPPPGGENNTNETDTNPPEIEDYEPRGDAFPEGTNPVILEIRTSELAVCKFGEDPLEDFEDMTDLDGGDFKKNHDKKLYNVETNIELEYYVLCEDALGNLMEDPQRINFSVYEATQGIPPPPPPPPPPGGVVDPTETGNEDETPGSEDPGNEDDVFEPSCVASPIEGEWGACINRQQERTVADSNGCFPDEVQKRLCTPGNTELENQALNKKVLKLIKDIRNKRTYRTTLTASYNELFTLEEEIPDNSFIVIDDATGEEYLGRLVDNIDGEKVFSLERIDESNLAALKTEGIIPTPIGEAVDASIENALSSRWFVTLSVVISVLLVIGVILLSMFYIKKSHK